MSNLIRYYNPLDRVFDRTFGVFLPSASADNGAGNRAIALDVVETPEAYIVRAELPGIAKDKIEVLIPVNGKPTPHDVTNEIREACTLLVAPCVEGIVKLVSSFNPEFQERIKNNVVLSGGGGQMDGLGKKIEDNLGAIGGGKVTVVEEPLYAGANGALQLAMDMPGEYWQQLR